MEPGLLSAFAVGLATVLLQTAAGRPATTNAHSADTTRLVVGRSYARLIAGGEVQVYVLRLHADRWVYIEADQRSVDVHVTVYAPNGQRVRSFDGPAKGIEPVQFVASVGGDYHVAVRSAANASGEYRVTVRHVERPASTPADRMRQLMMSHSRAGVAGGVVTVVRGGRAVFSRGYGLANLENGARNLPSTPYHLASISKQFTAFAIALLESRGMLSFDDDVRRFVPELFAYPTPVTLYHLLHHTSGLRDDLALWEMAGGRGDDAVRQHDLWQLILRQRELNFAPGSEYDYSNSGYLLLAEVVSRVSGQSFRDFMRANVFLPLGMTHTHINDDHERVIAGRAHSYEYSTEGMKEDVLSSGSTGATGVISTAEDLVKWLSNWGSARVGGREVREAMWQRGVLDGGDSIRYALGVNVRTFHGLLRIDHGGYQAGFRTMLVYYPALDAGVIVLGNTPGFPETTLADQVSQIFFGDAFEPDPLTSRTGTALGTPSPVVEAAAPWRPDSLILRQYTGRFHSVELETEYEIILRDGALFARHRRHGDIPLTPRTRDTLTSPNWMFGRVEFERDGTGRIVRFRVTASNERVRRLLFERM